MQRYVLFFIFSSAAVFALAYIAPREMPVLERAVIWVALFAVAAGLAYMTDRVVKYLRGA